MLQYAQTIEVSGLDFYEVVIFNLWYLYILLNPLRHLLLAVHLLQIMPLIVWNIVVAGGEPRQDPCGLFPMAKESWPNQELSEVVLLSMPSRGKL